MHTCLVLGAGATLANALHFRSERMASKNPPLDYTFFDKIDSLGITVPGDLHRYASSAGSINPFRRRSGQPPERMEEFFRDVFIDFQEAGSTTARAVRAYSQLVDIYVRVLRETTDWIGEDGRKGGPVGRLLSAAADQAEQLTVLTFNHDLVIENEVMKRARLRKRWCLEQCYGLFGGKLNFTQGGSTLLFPVHGPGCDHTRPITILKLHGSLNWYVRMRGQQPSRSTLSGTAKNPTVVYCSRRRAVPHQLRSTEKTREGSRTKLYTWPVVVPPIHAKDALIRNFIPEVWIDANSALRNADRLVFFGYSIPFLDINAERTFRRALAENRNIDWIDVINPATDSAARYAQVCSPKPMRWYPSVDALLSSDNLA